MAKFLIIDDHPLFRDALNSAIITAYRDSRIKEAASMAEAYEVLENCGEFDLALLDLKIPDTSGFDGLLEIRSRFPRLPILVVSGHEEAHIIKLVLSYGAAGFIPKSARKPVLTEAILKVMNGGIYVPDDYQEPEDDAGSNTNEKLEIIRRMSTLTRQQRRVIGMIRDGLLNKQIAYELNVGETTVKAHVSEILKKLGVNNRTQAAMELSKLTAQEFDELNQR